MTQNPCVACKASLDKDAIFCNVCGRTQPQTSARICAACKAPVDGSSRFCSQCAFDLATPIQEKTAQLTCPTCKKVALKNDKYCRHCSTDLSKVTAKKESSAHYCTKCGKPFLVTDKFCRHCAADISESNQTVAIPVARDPTPHRPQPTPLPSTSLSEATGPVWPPPERTVPSPVYATPSHKLKQPPEWASAQGKPATVLPVTENCALWVDRFLAAGIDLGFAILATIVLYLLLMIVGTLIFSVGASVDNGPLGAAGCGTCFLAFVLPPLGYFLAGIFNKVFLVITRGYSIGQSMMGLRVVDSKGNMIDAATSFLRLVCTVALGFTVVGGLLDLVYPLFDEPTRQTLHDKAVGTFVVKVR